MCLLHLYMFTSGLGALYRTTFIIFPQLFCFAHSRIHGSHSAAVGAQKGGAGVFHRVEMYGNKLAGAIIASGSTTQFLSCRRGFYSRVCLLGCYSCACLCSSYQTNISAPIRIYGILVEPLPLPAPVSLAKQIAGVSTPRLMYLQQSAARGASSAGVFRPDITVLKEEPFDAWLEKQPTNSRALLEARGVPGTAFSSSSLPSSPLDFGREAVQERGLYCMEGGLGRVVDCDIFSNSLIGIEVTLDSDLVVERSR